MLANQRLLDLGNPLWGDGLLTAQLARLGRGFVRTALAASDRLRAVAGTLALARA
jgi:hypothetical protein